MAILTMAIPTMQVLKAVGLEDYMELFVEHRVQVSHRKLWQ